MIQAEGLTRSYGPHRAVEDLGFFVDKGEVVGFLGPNGAGKTTTMRMLATYLSPTRGRALVAGHDVVEAPLKARKDLGYLPEMVPLYEDVRARDYLTYRAKLRDVPRSRRKSAIDRVVAATHLEEVAGRWIGQLSRGQRQRVGLADALLHDPKVLILDEPTAGLDPIQAREARSLVRELGAERTLLISTHVLSEVEAVCSRVLVLSQGRLVLDRPMDALGRGTVLSVEVRGPAESVRREALAVSGTRSVKVLSEADGVVELEIEGEDVRERLAARIVAQGWGLRRMDWRKDGLEEAFLRAVAPPTSPDALPSPLPQRALF